MTYAENCNLDPVLNREEKQFPIGSKSHNADWLLARHDDRGG